ncbi:NUDIX hydrolase [Hymenobacter arizonensis]|uniref:ADP-ribose pyrophosphatase YjhB, NUDIX family n=1 Tax=Hymenobacter arizonensis TaxID=1227077 RepID=A0A1I6A811_HYMAR|nr:NUDIX domain-containing protein [Hymenobacter arizonensis]SFQ64772.1 ADP-ribose pyrophosphatase YjhB, NUDIX family [Hymenobacter arizonensis]
MNSPEEVVDFIYNGHQRFLPHLSIDCVIFGYHDQQLKILLIRYHDQEHWSLPGGYVERQEGLTAAAHRILSEKTQLTNLYLQQFYTFGDSPTRLNRIEIQDNHNKVYAKANVAIDEEHWLSKRTLSVGYYALVDYHEVSVTPEFLVVDYAWVDVNAVPSLQYDHNEIIDKALLTLRSQLYQQSVGYNLLPEKFTLSEIQALYEAILGKPFDRRNFRKKMVALGVIRQLDERRKIGPHRSPYLYDFNLENASKLQEAGGVIF